MKSTESLLKSYENSMEREIKRVIGSLELRAASKDSTLKVLQPCKKLRFLVVLLMVVSNFNSIPLN